MGLYKLYEWRRDLTNICRKSRQGQIKGTMAKWPVQEKLTQQEIHETRSDDYLTCIVYSSIFINKNYYPNECYSLGTVNDLHVYVQWHVCHSNFNLDFICESRLIFIKSTLFKNEFDESFNNWDRKRQTDCLNVYSSTLEFHRLVYMFYIMTLIDHVMTGSIYKPAVAKTFGTFPADGIEIILM